MRTFVLLLSVSACSGGGPGDSGAPPAEWTTPPGDAEAGRAALLDGDYVRCGIPKSVYEEYFGISPRQYRVDGRDDRNKRLAYYLTEITSESGVDLVTTNCLYCHAQYFRGEVVIGLGNPSLDFTEDSSTYAALVPALVTDEAEKAEAQKWADRMVATGPSIVTETVGANPADTLAQALFAHRDAATLAWSEDALLDLPPAPIPTDVPPLWNLRKKTASLYTGSGQGNLARIMMTASALCTDDTDEAADIYADFPDIHAFFAEMAPPPFPEAVDPTLATQGEAVFADHCASCHGTYGDDWTYDTPVVPAEEVGTDPMLAERFGEPTAAYGEWFNTSWYGQDARLTPTGGYVAPPLDGVWATAPYLHNGSVPTLAALLDSSLRPVSYRRKITYDLVSVGWEWEDAPDGRETAGMDEIEVYDTRLPGYSAAGHTYGDALTTDERAAVLAYLETL